MTAHSDATARPARLWTQLLAWLKNFDEAFDYDPADHALHRLGSEVETLRTTVRRLEERASNPR